MKVSCIIQARRKSTRLPNKVLCDLEGAPVLEHVVQRCLLIPEVTDVVCALVDDPYEEPLRQLASEIGVRTYSGSEEDVLDRYYQAAMLNPSDYIMRVTSDCPLLDPTICSSLIRAVASGGYDYGVLGGWPHGLDCEVFPVSSLIEAHKHAKTKGHREHVTLWMTQNPSYSKVFVQPDNLHIGAGHRWVIDYPEDYQFLKEVFSLLDKPVQQQGYQAVIDKIATMPSISNINKKCAQSWNEATQKIKDDANDFDKSIKPRSRDIIKLSDIS